MKLKKLKLNELSKTELNEREMCQILGGSTSGMCQCGCLYEGKPGGSSTGDNHTANVAGNYTSAPTLAPPPIVTPDFSQSDYRCWHEQDGVIIATPPIIPLPTSSF